MHSPDVLFSAEKIRKRIEEIGSAITSDYDGKEVIMVATLRGAFMFFADLVRQVELPMVCEFLALSNYSKEAPSSGELKVTLDFAEPVVGKHVIIVEDIVDTGVATNFLVKYIKARNPASIRTCCLVMKQDSLLQPIDVDYCGFKIESEFVVGYGIDHKGQYRWLPYIGRIPQHVS